MLQTSLRPLITGAWKRPSPFQVDLNKIEKILSIPREERFWSELNSPEFLVAAGVIESDDPQLPICDDIQRPDFPERPEMARIKLYRRGSEEGDDQEEGGLTFNRKRPRTSDPDGSSSAATTRSETPRVEVSPSASPIVSPILSPAISPATSPLPPRSPALPSSTAPLTRMSTRANPRSRSQEKGKGVATDLPPPPEIDPTMLMAMPEHLRAAMNLMSQDFTQANWTDMRSQHWVDLMQICFSSINTALFSMTQALEPATTAGNLEKSLRAEIVALQADNKKAQLAKKKAEDTVERVRTKAMGIVNARNEFEKEVIALKVKLDDERREHERLLAEEKRETERRLDEEIKKFTLSPAFNRLLSGAVESFKTSSEMRRMLEAASEKAVKDWKDSAEYRLELDKAETLGADDLVFTINKLRPDIDLSFLEETPATPVLPVDNSEVEDLTIISTGETIRAEVSTLSEVEGVERVVVVPESSDANPAQE